MESKFVIRNERESDFEKVETLTREAFYNVYVPGCMEHYLVRNIRSHEDFVPELDFVLELDGEIAGSIMYTKATLTDEKGNRKEILTFGPLCVSPKVQRRGYGKLLMEHSFARAAEMGYEAIVIFGSPSNYVSSGFKSCRTFNVCTEERKYPAAMLVKELAPGALDGRQWIYRESPAMAIRPEEAQAYDDTLEPMEKKWLPSQEEFYILSNSFLQ